MRVTEDLIRKKLKIINRTLYFKTDIRVIEGNGKPVKKLFFSLWNKEK